MLLYKTSSCLTDVVLDLSCRKCAGTMDEHIEGLEFLSETPCQVLDGEILVNLT